MTAARCAGASFLGQPFGSEVLFTGLVGWGLVTCALALGYLLLSPTEDPYGGGWAP